MRRFVGSTIPHRFVLALRVYPDLQGTKGWCVVRFDSAVLPQRYVRRIRKYPGFEQGGNLVGIWSIYYIQIHKHMIECDILTNKTSLYIYNDNLESFNSKSCKPGLGNACIRLWNKHNPKFRTKPYSASVVTGSFKHRGFSSLDKDTKNIIDTCFAEIRECIVAHNITEVWYSVNDDSGIIGQSLFQINDDVREYITQSIHNLSQHSPQILI